MDAVLALQAVEADETDDSQDFHSGGEGAAFYSDFQSNYYETDQADFEADA